MEVGDFFKLEHFDPSICKVGKGGLCNVCSKITALDSEIQRAHRLLKTLVLEREAVLKARVNHTHDPIIRRLPVEVVSLIFTFYVTDREPLLVDGKIRRFLVVDGKRRFKKADCSAPLVISAVCRRWREIAFSTPLLWATLNIPLIFPASIPLQTELTTQWLGRSGRLPLHISIFNCNYTTPAVPVFEVVKTYAARWRKLNVLFSAASYISFFADLQGAPSLEDLQLWFDSNVVGFQLPATPRLKNFRTNFHVPSIKHRTQWTSLTSLQMSYTGVDEMLELLRYASNLKKCLVSIRNSNSGGYLLPSEPITHQCLMDLEIRSTSQLVALLLDHLILPSLIRFSDDIPWGNNDSPFPTDTFISFLHRSRLSVLQEFEIKGSHNSMTDEKLFQILESIPSIKLLSLKCIRTVMGWSASHLFQRFKNDSPIDSLTTGQSSAKASFLPDLERLSLEFAIHRPFSWDSFLVFLESTYTSFLDARSRDSSPTRTHIDICLKLCREYNSSPPYIEPDIVSRLVNPHWSKFISLKILDMKEIDLIQEALRYRYDADEDME